MGVSTSCPAKPPPVDVHLSNFFVRLYFYFCCCTDIVFLWKCNGICGILKYGFQKSQTLAVRSDAEFPLQIPAWQKRIPCQPPPWARCDQHLGKKDGPGIWRFFIGQGYGVTTTSRNKNGPEIWCDQHLWQKDGPGIWCDQHLWQKDGPGIWCDHQIKKQGCPWKGVTG